jgi:hypothetical protein
VGCGGATSILFQSSILTDLLKFQDSKLKLQRTTIFSLNYDFLDEYMVLLKEIQLKQHGFCTPQSNVIEDILKATDSYCCVVRRDGKLVGLMVFNLLDPESKKVFTINRMMLYSDENVKKCLLNFVALHMDTFEWIRMELPPGRDPSQFITDLTTKRDPTSITPLSSNIHFQVMSPQMGRVIVIEDLSGMKLKCMNVSITFEVKDKNCDWNNAVYRFQVKEGVLTVTKLENVKSTFWLDIRGISALVFGSVYDSSEIASNNWGNPSDKDSEILMTMFPYQIAVFFMKF